MCIYIYIGACVGAVCVYHACLPVLAIYVNLITLTGGLEWCMWGGILKGCFYIF